jgi:serine/threonine protein kinase
MITDTPTLTPHTVQLGDNFTIKQALATGGAARIYLAKQISLDREVVVKVLRQQLSSQPEFQDRFATEARLLARLEHPNIVQIIDFGDHDGSYYFIMEYVRGGSLGDLLDRADFIPLDVALSIAQFIVRGLAYVHENQVLHLDIKPANILLTRQGIIKVADFGLARIYDEGKSERRRRGHPAGTPLFMSPEQVQGMKLDIRSDLFSFGILLYQLLTFHNPFQGRSTEEVYQLIRACRVEPPSTLRSEIPLPLDNLVMTCLERDRAKRYASAVELLADLNSVLEFLGIHNPEQRVAKFIDSPFNYRAVLKRTSAHRRKFAHLRKGRKTTRVLVVLLVATLLLAADALMTLLLDKL